MIDLEKIENITSKYENILNNFIENDRADQSRALVLNYNEFIVRTSEYDHKNDILNFLDCVKENDFVLAFSNYYEISESKKHHIEMCMHWNIVKAQFFK